MHPARATRSTSMHRLCRHSSLVKAATKRMTVSGRYRHTPIAPPTFGPEAEQTRMEFTSPEAQVRNQKPELRNC